MVSSKSNGMDKKKAQDDKNETVENVQKDA